MALSEYEQEQLTSALRRDDLDGIPQKLLDTFEKFKKIADRVNGGAVEINAPVLALVIMLSGVEIDMPPKVITEKRRGTVVEHASM